MTCDKNFFRSIVLIAVIVFLCGNSTADIVASGDAVVAITGSGFVPQNLIVTQGATVTWSNNDVNAYYQASHIIITDQTDTDSTYFLSTRMGPGDTYSYIFDQPGTVIYHSESDPSMRGRIVVLPLVPTTISTTTTTIPKETAFQGALSNKKYNVYIVDHAFVPQQLVVEPGSTVVWVNNDGNARYVVYHRIKSDASNAGDLPYLDSPIFGLGDIYGFTFPTPGGYGYHCDLYPDMTGSVIVPGSKTAASAATATTMPPASNNLSSFKPGATQTVLLKDGAFSPADISISRGTTVLWINDGPGTYRIVSGQELHAIGTSEPAEDSSEVEFNSDQMTIGEIYSYTFNLPGTYSYRDEQRSGMTGTVTVL